MPTVTEELPLSADTIQFTDDRGTWISKALLPDYHIDNQTIGRLIQRKEEDKPHGLSVCFRSIVGQPKPRRFVLKEDIEAYRAILKSAGDGKIRPKEKLWAFEDEALLEYGISRHQLNDYSETTDARSKGKQRPHPVLERFIGSEWRDVISRHGIRPERVWLRADLQAIKDARETPLSLPGMISLAEAAAITKLSTGYLSRLITEKHLDAQSEPSVRSSGLPAEMLFVSRKEVERIAQHREQGAPPGSKWVTAEAALDEFRARCSVPSEVAQRAPPTARAQHQNLFATLGNKRIDPSVRLLAGRS